MNTLSSNMNEKAVWHSWRQGKTLTDTVLSPFTEAHTIKTNKVIIFKISLKKAGRIPIINHDMTCNSLTNLLVQSMYFSTHHDRFIEVAAQPNLPKTNSALNVTYTTLQHQHFILCLTLSGDLYQRASFKFNFKSHELLMSFLSKMPQT